MWPCSLVEVLVELAEAQGAYKCSLECKDHLIGFYEKMGFKVIAMEALPEHRMRCAKPLCRKTKATTSSYSGSSSIKSAAGKHSSPSNHLLTLPVFHFA